MSTTTMTNEERSFNFMALRKVMAGVSIAVLLASILSLFINQLQFGLDFTGGALIEVEYSQEKPLDEIRQTLVGAGYESAIVQTFGSPTDIMVRLQEDHTPTLGDDVLAALRSGSTGNVELLRSEFVGAQVGDELREQGGLGMLLALAIVMLYVAMRFQFKFSVGAVVALAHDVLIVLGLFSILKLDFDLTVLAALLAVIGYSLNDTIVVSDRIRENFRKLRKGSSEEIINVSLNQTLGRTLVTSLTTLLVLIALFFFGGEMIHGFATALMIGVLVGTYSSIYVAANVLLAMNVTREDLLPPVKEEEEDDRP
ncbi:protein translocase subunit SecF [Motiliproteus sp.]|uniref:protein translocase subunit SecF n=1 Tax=Motiliproteus sp. TaxID=1898955 RepID=UPI003BA92CA5